MIPQAKIEAIKESVSLHDVVSESVRLKRRGEGYVGLCPFHAERTPSFSVGKKDDREFFRCFGCGAGGDVIEFVRRIDNVGFDYAVRTLAKRVGIEIEDVTSASTEKESIYAANEFASKWFQSNLIDAARAYLEGRLSAEAIFRFGLGRAGEGWRELSYALRKAGFSEEIAVKAGLMRAGDRGAYDVFRGGRLMIPIRNEFGNVVGFGGRAMRKEDKPLYVNTADGIAYRKGNVLFGLWEAREVIKRTRRVILVEGYFDAMKLIERGYPAVAICGTSLTQAQAEKIARIADSVLLMFDSDKAGQAATARAGEMLAPTMKSVYVASLPEGKDPDELSEYETAFAAENAADLFYWLFTAGVGFDKLAEIVAKIESPLSYQKAVGVLGTCFRVSSSKVEIAVEKAQNKTRERKAGADTMPTTSKAPATEEDRAHFERAANLAARRQEILSYKEQV